MNVHDRVCVTDAEGTHSGTVMMRYSDGMCFVKWDTGVTERIHEDELDAEDGGRPLDDPKHPTYRERLAELWDSRPWK